MDSKNRIGYICLGNHVGFDVVNLQTGKVLHRVLRSRLSGADEADVSGTIGSSS
jgi:hypothetical protein